MSGIVDITVSFVYKGTTSSLHDQNLGSIVQSKLSHNVACSKYVQRQLSVNTVNLQRFC